MNCKYAVGINKIILFYHNDTIAIPTKTISAKKVNRYVNIQFHNCYYFLGLLLSKDLKKYIEHFKTFWKCSKATIKHGQIGNKGKKKFWTFKSI